MKPDEDMHAAMEEVDLDPCDLYTDLGSLIVEGRVPGLTDKGFGEGPHCPVGPLQNRHQCDPTSPQCQKYEHILKHMLLLWKNGIPMTIEVLLHPNCCSPQNVESTPEMSYLLLEQWTIHMLPKRVPDANISPRGLIQAVRSFLYFSQLCAWFSLTGGKSPKNVTYRVCVPGEAFSSKFSSQPDCHIFPVANVGRNSAMKVLMKSHPRCGEIPRVPCEKHSQTASLKCRKREQKPIADFGEYAFTRTSSPADTMLGESLLDPPNSLCMYPKRYQSPSRCGSPSIEVPEHLMFGKPKLEEEPRQSRPQRRPVIERFLKQNLENDLDRSDTNSRTLDRRTSAPNMSKPDILGMKNDYVLNFCCIEEDMKNVPQEEMEEILERLREKNIGSKCKVWNAHSLSEMKHNKPLTHFFDKLKIDSDFIKHNKESKKYIFYKNDENDSKNLPSRKFDRKAIPSSSTEKSSHFPDSHKFYINNNSQIDYPPKESLHSHLLENQLNALQSSSSSSSLSNHKNSNSKLIGLPKQNIFEAQNTTQRDAQYSQVHPRLSSVNIKKCGTLLTKDDNVALTDERDISDSLSSRLSSSLLKDMLPCIIPSAEKKALFRRSLDSARNLVFHQRSGLPLTSSPAPVRKCGTCFDFDSSLTSVSAIKRALIYKELEEEKSEEEKAANLSTSAPASIVSSSLLGTFEESVLNGRLEPVSTVEGFTAEIGASGSFCPRHINLPVTVFFYTLQDMDKVTSPYMGHINLRDKDYHIPKKGTVQVTLFNPHRTVVKMFVVRYDLSDMPVNSQTFLRQRTLYMPSDASENDKDAQKWLRYLIHLRFMSSKSGRIYLHTDVRVIIFRKSDLDAATVHGQRPYELRSFTHAPLNPKFSSHKI